MKNLVKPQVQRKKNATSEIFQPQHAIPGDDLKTNEEGSFF
jgi:hypothetical protein